MDAAGMRHNPSRILCYLVLSSMSLARVVLLTIQAFCHHISCTLPNPTPSPKGRYYMDELYILQVGPLIYAVCPASFNHHRLVISLPDTQIHCLALPIIRNTMVYRRYLPRLRSPIHTTPCPPNKPPLPYRRPGRHPRHLHSP